MVSRTRTRVGAVVAGAYRACLLTVPNSAVGADVWAVLQNAVADGRLNAHALTPGKTYQIGWDMVHNGQYFLRPGHPQPCYALDVVNNPPSIDTLFPVQQLDAVHADADALHDRPRR
jgi:hypothetical protein